MTENSIGVLKPLTGLYEPSAILQLADGRFLVVEDEKAHPFSLVSISAQGGVSSSPLTPGFFESADSFWKLDDLEGLTIDRSGAICAITSHSRDGEGDQKKSREKLVRFRIEGNRVVEQKLAKGLKSALIAKHPVLAAAAELSDVKGSGGLNVEALEFSADQQHLLVGLRSPLLDKRAIIACIENPTGLFENDEPPRVSARLETLDLGGHGIRGMTYFPCYNGFLVIGGPVSREPVPFRLWFWSGAPSTPARRVDIPGLSGIECAEGICPALIDGQQKIIIVSDDGNRSAGRFARYLILDPGELQIAA